MVTEPLLHLLLPLRSERSSLNIDKHPLFSQRHAPHVSGSPQAARKKHGKGKRSSSERGNLGNPILGERKGWREFISSNLDEDLAREVGC